MPWNAKDGVGRLRPGIPKSDLTRGIRGCYVSFMDAPTRDCFMSRTEPGTREYSRAAEFSTA